MNNSPGMQRCKSLSHLSEDNHGLVWRQAMRFSQSLGERVSRQQPHREKREWRRGLIAAEDIVDRAKIRMCHLSSKQHLLLKASLRLSIRCKLRQNHLQSNMHVLKEAVLYLINLSHSSRRDEA